MTLLRFVSIALTFVMAVALGVLLAPVAWWSPLVAKISSNMVTLARPSGSLWRGEATLRSAANGIETPVSWQGAFPLRWVIAVGGGEAQLSILSPAVDSTTPITLAVRHAQLATPAVVTLAPGARAWRDGGQWRANAELSAPQLAAQLPTSLLQLENVKLSLGADGKLSGSASGDAAIGLSGTMSALSPPRGAATLTLSPSGRNKSFDAAVRASLPASGNNQYSYAYTFR